MSKFQFYQSVHWSWDKQLQERVHPCKINLHQNCSKIPTRLSSPFFPEKQASYIHTWSQCLVLRWPINQSVCKQIHHCYIKRKVTHQLRHLVTVFLITIWDTFSEDLIFPGCGYNILNMPPSVKKKTHLEPLNFSFLSSVFLHLPNFCFIVFEPLYLLQIFPFICLFPSFPVFVFSYLLHSNLFGFSRPKQTTFPFTRVNKTS